MACKVCQDALIDYKKKEKQFSVVNDGLLLFDIDSHAIFNNTSKFLLFGFYETPITSKRPSKFLLNELLATRITSHFFTHKNLQCLGAVFRCCSMLK